eukprot:3438850-Amphidinium_carterae.1
MLIGGLVQAFCKTYQSVHVFVHAFRAKGACPQCLRTAEGKRISGHQRDSGCPGIATALTRGHNAPECVCRLVGGAKGEGGLHPSEAAAVATTACPYLKLKPVSESGCCLHKWPHQLSCLLRAVADQASWPILDQSVLTWWRRRLNYSSRVSSDVRLEGKSPR